MSVTMSVSSRGWLRRATRFALAVLAVVLTGGALWAQDTVPDDAVRWPRFLLATNGDITRVEPLGLDRPSVLSQVVTLDVKDGRFGDVAHEITKQTGVNLVYSSDLVSPSRRVTIRADRTPLANLLTELLHDANVDVVVVGNQATLVRKAQPARRSAAAKQQPGVITGRVVEKGTNTPIASVQILIDSVGRGITNPDGYYRIAGIIPGRRKVSAVSIGYRTGVEEVEVGEGQTVTVNFFLEAAPTQLSELIVTATGEERRRVEIGHDIVVINADSIVKREPITSVADLLEGRVPGLVVQRSSGTPGDPARIRIRGVSSPNLSNDPIIVVDGVRVYSAQSDERAGNLASMNVSGSPTYNAPSPLDYMDPSMIETIQVIKGPSAATMYGQDAASGVIVITTKKGQPGTTRWTVSMDYGQTQLARRYPERYLRWGRALDSDQRVVCPANGQGQIGTAKYGPCLPDNTVLTFQTLNDSYLSPIDRGQAAALRVGVSGGASGLTYSVNASYLDEVGVVKLSRYESERFRSQHGTPPPEWMQRPQNFTRWGVNSHIQAQLGSDVTVSLSSNVTRTEQQRSNLERTYIRLDGIYIDPSTGLYLDNTGGNTDARVDFFQRATARATRFTNAFNMNWRAQSWLTVTATAGLNVDQRADDVFLPAGVDFSTSEKADGDLRRAQGTSVVPSVQLNARTQVPLGLGFSLRVASGVDYTGTLIEDITAYATELPEGVESLHGLGAPITGADEYRDQRATFGWYIEPGIAHRRMWLNLGLRFDGGSSFGSNVKLPAFPKLSYSYLISDEPYFPEALRSIFDQLRLRVAYGHAGRQPGPTDRLRLYSTPIIKWINGSQVEVVDLDHLGNTKLKPERSKEVEGGFDADLFDDRLSVSVTAYQKTTKDQLLHVPLPPSVYGANVTQLQNIGITRNAGLELAVDVEPVRRELVIWRLGLNFSQNRNKVIKLGEGVEPFYSSGTPISGLRVVPGYPLHGRWNTPVLGYDDVNGDGVLEEHEVVLGDTAVYVGATLPKYEMGLFSSLSLFRGALSVSAGLTYSDGLTQRNDVGGLRRGWWDPAAPGAILDQLRFHDKSGFTRNETVNQLRLNSLSVGWQVPKSWARLFGASSLTLLLQGDNLGLWTNYSGMDPNVNGAVGGNNIVDNGVLPTPRTWQFRVNATY